jgi:hypothetical protein
MKVSAQQWYDCCCSLRTEEQAYAWREIRKGSPHGAGVCAPRNNNELEFTMPRTWSIYVGTSLFEGAFLMGRSIIVFCCMNSWSYVASNEMQHVVNGDPGNMFFEVLPPFPVRTAAKHGESQSG